MTVRTMDPAQVRSLQHHCDAAAALGDQTLRALRALVRQLSGLMVLPLIGAGGSYDCGMRLASQLGRDLLTDWEADPTYQPRPSGLTADLGRVADAIYLGRSNSQQAVLDAIGIPDHSLWPGADELDEHFCVYRVLARLAREGLFDHAASLNYDCGGEAGMKAEGFLVNSATSAGRSWNDHATVVADATTHDSPTQRGNFVFVKAHGCAEHYREQIVRAPGCGAENEIIIRRAQLLNWGTDLWARDFLRLKARNHVLLLVGFSGQDPVIYSEIDQVLSDVYHNTTPTGKPRVVVIDPRPDTSELLGLISTGLGGERPDADAITSIATTNGSMTAAMMVLLAEMLALTLDDSLAAAGVSVPDAVDGRLAMLVLAAPVMLRWSYLLREAEPERAFIQRINLQQAAERGYVPLHANTETTARAIASRIAVRGALGLGDPESTVEVLSNGGWILAPAQGAAWLPVGVGHEQLLAAAAPSGTLDHARRVLPRPAGLECVLVSDGPVGRRGISLDTGKEVAVP
jgi:SIR2-like domain